MKLFRQLSLAGAVLGALSIGTPASADPDCPGDANGDGQVVFDDITAVLSNFNAQCGAPAIEYLGDAIPDQLYLQQVLASPLTQAYGATLGQQGLIIDPAGAAEVFYNDFDQICPATPADARFMMIPIIDQQSNLPTAIFAYTSSDMMQAEGADVMSLFDPAIDPNQNTIRVFVDPQLSSWLDIELTNNDCNTVVTSSENPGVPFDNSGDSADRGGSYLQCVGMGIAPKILLAKGLGLDKACILSCRVCAGAPTPFTCSGCAACAAVAVGIIAHVWWCCP